MGHLSIRHGTAQHVIARTQNETRWVARFWREHFCRTWREDLCNFTHQFVSCSFLFRALENQPTSAALAELDSDPDSPHLDQFPPGQQRSSLPGLYHSGTAQPSAPSWRSTDDLEGREACRSRSCSWLFTGARQRLAVDVFPRSGGFRGVADFVHGKMEGVHVWSFEAFPRTRAFVFTLPWLFCILASRVFNFFSSGSDRHFSSDNFSFGSSWPFYFFFIFVFSLCLFCLPRQSWWKFIACHPVRDAMRNKTKLPWNLYYFKSNWYDLRNSQRSHSSSNFSRHFRFNFRRQTSLILYPQKSRAFLYPRWQPKWRPLNLAMRTAPIEAHSNPTNILFSTNKHATECFKRSNFKENESKWSRNTGK